jgi:predicted RNA-binding protein with PUA-like domain
MAYWLVKSEPGSWSFGDHMKKGVERWDGVRNYQAANNLKSMTVGDKAFFYHSVDEKRIVGILEVVGEAYPDPTDPAGRFVCVDFKAVAPLPRAVTLADIKADLRLGHLALLRQSRLSVVPVDEAAWQVLCHMGGLTVPA